MFMSDFQRFFILENAIKNVKNVKNVTRIKNVKTFFTSMKYAEPRSTHTTQFRLECSSPKLLDQSSPKFYTI